jgi:ribonuclease HII
MPMATRAPVPHLEYERAFWRHGYRSVAGVDEVGRGALAGPLVAAAVVLPCCVGGRLGWLRRRLSDVRDSKLLTHNNRVRISAIIAQEADQIGLGIVESTELDAIGVAAANRLAMERAVFALPRPPEALLLDACTIDLGQPQVGLIDGDAMSLTIAAASIVAKVTRDRIMVDVDGLHPRYAFAIQKGYGPAAHLAVLKAIGPSPLHRRCFHPVSEAMR